MTIPIRLLNLSCNVTPQESIIASGREEWAGFRIGKRIPNVPSYFYNVSASYGIGNSFGRRPKTTVLWDFNFIEDFSCI
jgi:hypothetical protein